jgi:hypothetical protein
MEPAEIDLDVTLLTGIVDRVPRFGWLDRGYDPASAASDDDRSAP